MQIKNNQLYNAKDVITVTKSFLPPLSEYQKYLKLIWQRGQLSNNGPLAIELTNKLQDYLQVDNLLLLTNGTLALQIAYKTLDLSGEIITTPFSYVATTSSLIWERLTPVFVDIDPLTFNIDPQKIEQAITAKTTAIVATHVFGNPCDIEAINKIAKKHKLKVVYDAAHAFMVKYKNKSIFKYGDISIASLHATKLFHTAEGGFIVAKNKTLFKKAWNFHNFGHKGWEKFSSIGINAKMSELQAAMGLSILPFVSKVIKKRKTIFKWYKERLNTEIKFQNINNDAEYNYAYFPIVFRSEEDLDVTVKKLRENNIYPRRYFYPSLNKLPYVNNQVMPVSEKISKTILCLPIYHELSLSQVKLITDIINI